MTGARKWLAGLLVALVVVASLFLWRGERARREQAESRVLELEQLRYRECIYLLGSLHMSMLTDSRIEMLAARSVRIYKFAHLSLNCMNSPPVEGDDGMLRVLKLSDFTRRDGLDEKQLAARVDEAQDLFIAALEKRMTFLEGTYPDGGF